MSSTPRFKIWRARHVDGYCVIRPPTDVPKAFQLARGVSRAEGWPSALLCRMSDDFPKDIQLPDSYFGASWVIVSPRVCTQLQSRCGPEVEFLGIGIADHKGRTVAQDCAVVNPLTVVDAIDVPASEVTWNQIRSDLISECKRLVIDASRVPDSLQLFRLRHLERLVIARAELAAQLESAGFVGLDFEDPAAFDGT